MQPGPLALQLAAMQLNRGPAMLGLVGLRCLIIDDSAGFLQAARALLEQEGMTVVGCGASHRPRPLLLGFVRTRFIRCQGSAPVHPHAQAADGPLAPAARDDRPNSR